MELRGKKVPAIHTSTVLIAGKMFHNPLVEGIGISLKGKRKKKVHQVDYILINADTKRSSWFYFDIDHQKLL